MIRRMLPLSRTTGAGWALAVALAAPLGAEPLDTFRDCDACPEMIELPMGDFVMGAPDDEFRSILYIGEGKMNIATVDGPEIVPSEGPQNRVKIDIRIAMGKNEVTFGEWMACVNDGGCNGYIPDGTFTMVGTSEDIRQSITDPRFKRVSTVDRILQVLDTSLPLPMTDRSPVSDVSYLDALAYVAWINKKLNTDAYRLPTEAEFEFAARAGTTTRFPQGFEPTSDQANFSGGNTASHLMQERPDLRSLGFPVTVDELDAANGWGLRHMIGNLDELTLSCYSGYKNPLPNWSSTSEWLAKSFAESCERTSRGGGYFDPVENTRPAMRRGIDEDTRLDFTGFRIVKVMN